MYKSLSAHTQKNLFETFSTFNKPQELIQSE